MVRGTQSVVFIVHQYVSEGVLTDLYYSIIKVSKDIQKETPVLIKFGVGPPSHAHIPIRFLVECRIHEKVQ